MDISIVIPTHNRCASLRKCLDALLSQDYPWDKFEILVIDDGSTDATKDMVRELSRVHASLRLLSQPRQGPAAARNLGMREAAADIVGFTDDDCILSRDWLSKMVLAHQRDDAVAVGGLTRVSPRNTMACVSQFLSTGAIQADVHGKREVIFFPTCNVSLKKSRLNGDAFNESFLFPGGEDLDFFWRLFKKGHRFVYKEDIAVFHDCHPGLRSFLKQAYWYGRGNYLVQHLHQDQPLLKELKTGTFSFWSATLINILKIPRFSFLLGRKLNREHNAKNIFRKASVYSFFTIHKVFYLFGNVSEFFRIRKRSRATENIRPVPRLLILDITHACNLTCRICEIYKTKDREKDLDILVVEKMLRDAKALSIREVALSGGEVLMRSDITEIFEMARGLGIKNLGVLTNGVSVGPQWERLLPYICDNTISLVISFDSLRPDVHNKIRNSDTAWQRTRESLELLSSLKKNNPHVDFNVITVICDQNLQELTEVADFVHSIGAETLQFQPLLANNLNMAERKASPFWIPDERWEALDDAVDRLVVLKKNRPAFIKNSAKNLALIKKYFRGRLASGDVRCYSADETILVSNRGECTTCFSSYGNVLRLGLREILRGRARVEAFRGLTRCAWPCLLPCFCDKTEGTP